MNKGRIDLEMQKRVLALIDAKAPGMRGRVQWFMFGDKVDGYFEHHPTEVADYVRLWDLVATHLRAADADIEISTTVMYGGSINSMASAITQQPA